MITAVGVWKVKIQQLVSYVKSLPKLPLSKYQYCWTTDMTDRIMITMLFGLSLIAGIIIIIKGKKKESKKNTLQLSRVFILR